MDNKYQLLRNEYLKDREKQIAMNREYIEKGYISTWNVNEKIQSDNGIRRYSTDLRWKQYQDGTITREKAVELATKRMIKDADNTTEKGLAKLENVARAEDLSFITIEVTFSRYGGVAADVVTNSGRFSGHAGGWGYDKESAAVADAFNKDFSLLKVLYDLKEKGLAAGLTSDSKTACTGHDNRNIIGYGAGYSVLPYFEGGVGINCFFSILKKAGYKTNYFYGKHENMYRVVNTRKSITFSDNAGFFENLKKYDLMQVSETTFEGLERDTELTSFSDIKATLEDFAKDWQRNLSELELNYSWADIAAWSSFFTEYGRAYDLLEEFKENGIA